MLKTSAGPSGSFEAGKTYNLLNDIARNLINVGAAISLEKSIEMEAAVREDETENATLKEEAQPLGGGWYKLSDGRKVRKSELEGES